MLTRVKNHIMLPDMSITTDQLRAEIEATAAALSIAPSTVGERAGQGGRFYARLCEGKRVWPETADTVMQRLHKMRSSQGTPSPEGGEMKPDRPCLPQSDGNGAALVQGRAAE